VIENPDLMAHERDESLLPSDAGQVMQKRRYITCYDPSTAVSFETLSTIMLITSITSRLSPCSPARKYRNKSNELIRHNRVGSRLHSLRGNLF